MKNLVLIAAAGSLALALGACHNNKSDEAPVETNVTNLEAPIDNGVIVNDTAAAAPTPEVNATHAPAVTTADFSNGAQTQDDADATGMTARVARDEDGNEATPTH